MARNDFAIRRWATTCGAYRVEEHVHKTAGASALGQASALATVWYALCKVDAPWGDCWLIISRHRAKRPTMLACQAHAIETRKKR